MDANQAGPEQKPGDLEPKASEIDKALGNELRSWRSKRQLSQEDLGRLAGMNKKTVQRLEAGARPMDMDQMYRLCRALEIKPSTLIDGMEKEIGIE